MSSRDAFDVAQLALLGEAVDRLQDVAVFVWDDDRNYVAVNEAACALVGKTRAELLGMRVGDLTPDRAMPLFTEVQHPGVHTGEMKGHLDDDLRYVTCQTRVAGLPYMVSVVWRG